MHLKTKSGRLVELPNDDEEAAINAGIAADHDTYEMTDEAFAYVRPAHEVLPKIFPTEIAREMLKPRGRPKADSPKVHLNLRLDGDVVDGFKATGKGWQTRMNDVLRNWLESHRATGRA